MKKMMVLTAMTLGAMFAARVVFAEDVPADSSRLTYAENGDGTLTVIGVEEIVDGRLVVPESHDGSNVTALAMGAFAYKTDILDVRLPSTLGEVAMYSFLECSNLTNVEIQADVTNIGDGAFNRCEQLKRVTLPSTLVSIGWGAFSGCSELAEIDLPDSLVSIGSEAFALTGLTSVRLPASVETLGDHVFYNIGSLTNADLSASSVKVIYQETFCSCGKLATVTLPKGIAEIGSNSFNETALKSIWIPAPCTNIGMYAFGTVDEAYFEGNAPQTLSSKGAKVSPFFDNTRIYIGADATGFSGYPWDSMSIVRLGTVVITAFSVTDGKLHMTVALLDKDGKPQAPGEGREVELLGAEDLREDFEPCGSHELGKDGTFEAEIPGERRFFKVSLVDKVE